MTTSPESYEDDSNLSPAQWHSHSTSTHLTSSGGPPAKASLPMQKRRRVTRACDECRRKKIKCDGKQPCTHCTVYSYDCTYDQPSNRRRNPTPQYIEALEHRLQRAESLLKTFLPEVDFSDPNIDFGVLQPTHPHPKLDVHPPQIQHDPIAEELEESQCDEIERESLLESMVEATGRLDFDDQGHVDYHGHSSGFTFLQRMREQFGTLLGPDTRNANTLQIFRRPPLRSCFDSPKSGSGDSPMYSNLPNTADLPPRDVANELVDNCIEDACALLRFVHKPTFVRMLNRIYDTPAERYSDDENRFLPLLYVVLAVGTLFEKSEQNNPENASFESAINEGFKYFKAARQMIDITDCRDLTSLQTVLFMIIFLQSSAKMATCYSFVGIALTSSLRMGLHRCVSMDFNPIVRETRKRIFWVVRKMDTYVSALLGLPKTINDEDIDQELPVEVDDEYITKDKILPMPEGQLSMIAAGNAHVRIMRILAKVVKYIYPIKGLEYGRSSQTYKVSHARIREIETDLRDWMEYLPTELRFGSDCPPKRVRVQLLLRMAYAHVQLVLYRPFLHYISPNSTSNPVDRRSYACALKCVKVSRVIVHVTEEMKKRGLLNGAYWFTMYTTFFAILSLVFFTLENENHPECAAIFKDANDGRDTLASLAKRSQAADRCTQMLGTLLEQLPEGPRRGRERLQPTQKKRHAPSPSPNITQNNVNVSFQGSETIGSVQRANTYPTLSDAGGLKVIGQVAPFQPSLLGNDNLLNPGTRKSAPTLFSDILSGDILGLPTPESITTPVAPQQQQPQQLNPIFQLHRDGTAFADLNSMMFTSTDSLAYPNQPISMLENQPYNPDDTTVNNQLMSEDSENNILMSGDGTTGAPFDGLEVQLFGPMPPYLMHDQQPNTYILKQEDCMDVGNADMVNGGESGLPVQGRAIGSAPEDLEDIFGVDEWNANFTDHSALGL